MIFCSGRSNSSPLSSCLFRSLRGAWGSKSLKELTFIVELTWKSNVRCLDSGLKVVWVWEKVQSADKDAGSGFRVHLVDFSCCARCIGMTVRLLMVN